VVYDVAKCVVLDDFGLDAEVEVDGDAVVEDVEDDDNEEELDDDELLLGLLLEEELDDELLEELDGFSSLRCD
jgi:hypothetical protein